MEKMTGKFRFPIIVVIFLSILILSNSCTRTEPKISYGFIKLVIYQGEPEHNEHFSFFILADDGDGFDNLDELFLFHDREQLRWHLKNDEWLRLTIDGNEWIGSRSIAVQEGSLPRGVFRAVLINKGGEKTERNFIYDGNVRYPFPDLEIINGTYLVNSQWPVNRLVFFDSSGNYTNTVTLESLSGSMSGLRLPTGVRTAALWAEDEANFCSAFTYVVPVN